MAKVKPAPSLKKETKSVVNISTRRPVSADVIRKNLMANKKGIKIVQVAGSMMPLFPKKPNEGDGKLVFWIGKEMVKRARVRKGQSDEWQLNKYVILDDKTFEIVGEGQMPVPTALQDFFEGKEPKDFENALLIEYGGQQEPTGENRAGFKVWSASEVHGLSKEDYDL